jgi:hypothetical protein
MVQSGKAFAAGTTLPTEYPERFADSKLRFSKLCDWHKIELPDNVTKATIILIFI